MLADAILERLDSLFPTASNFYDLWELQVKGFDHEAKEVWLEAIDALLKLGMAEGKELRDGLLIADVANLTITPLGREHVAQRRQPSTSPKSNIVFLSHAASDQEIAFRLKRLIETATPGSEVFVSSDTENIRPGDEWVRRILDTLQVASVLLILATDRSLGRPWVWFETGAAWKSRLRIIPGCLGIIRKNKLSAPFSQYQALNLDEANDLRDLLRAVARETELSMIDVEVQTAIAEFQRLDNLAGVSPTSTPATEELELRFDLVHVSAAIEHGHASNFVVRLTNESNEVIEIKQVILLSERGIRITDPYVLTERNMVEARGRLMAAWRALPNPADFLISSHASKGFGSEREFQTDVEINVICEALGKIKRSSTRVRVLVDGLNRHITQIAG